MIVGTSHAGTNATRTLSQMAQELGAQGVMVTPSKEGVPIPDARMLEFFSKVPGALPGVHGIGAVCACSCEETVGDAILRCVSVCL